MKEAFELLRLLGERFPSAPCRHALVWVDDVPTIQLAVTADGRQWFQSLRFDERDWALSPADLVEEIVEFMKTAEAPAREPMPTPVPTGNEVVIRKAIIDTDELSVDHKKWVDVVFDQRKVKLSQVGLRKPSPCMLVERETWVGVVRGLERRNKQFNADGKPVEAETILTVLWGNPSHVTQHRTDEIELLDGESIETKKELTDE